MKENFEKIIPWVMEDEGFYSNDPGDPGGPTKYGITIIDYRKWLQRKNVTAKEVKAMPVDTVHKIYKQWYWDKVQADELPKGIDYFVFDCALLNGVGRARKWLQRAVGVPADGIIGPKTLEAAKKADPKKTVEKLADIRLASMKTLGIWHRFARGWTNRVRKTKQRGLSLLA